jgi:hypothetical protein
MDQTRKKPKPVCGSSSVVVNGGVGGRRSKIAIFNGILGYYAEKIVLVVDNLIYT